MPFKLDCGFSINCRSFRSVLRVLDAVSVGAEFSRLLAPWPADTTRDMGHGQDGDRRRGGSFHELLYGVLQYVTGDGDGAGGCRKDCDQRALQETV